MGVTDIFPTLPGAGKEARANVIDACGAKPRCRDVKLKERLPIYWELGGQMCQVPHKRYSPVRGRSHYKEIHCQVLSPTSSLE